MSHRAQNPLLKYGAIAVATLACVGCIDKPSSTHTEVHVSKNKQSGVADSNLVPADKFDLTHWSLTLPVDDNKNGKADVIQVPQLQSYTHSDYFYLNSAGHLVFMSPNKAATEVTSTNTRSELRYESRGAEQSIDEADPKNNWALAAKSDAASFDAIGGKLKATLAVDHVSLNAGYPNKPPAYSVVIAQIHAYQFASQEGGFGWGNEPLKLSYKKWPNHETGSVYWTYERNLDFDDPNRIDIEYPVWGRSWEDPSDPGEQGIALGEAFSYTVNVHENIMYLTFESERLGTVKHQIDLSNNIDANGHVDELDNPKGYRDDYLYFKAGNYNQCSTKDAPSFRYPACPGSGELAKDIADGNYTKVTFFELVVSASEAPN
ncbi:polysaccharide lyase family 7 protein [Neiella marina]|uniref:Polysaccharide lyase family 7 protein n=1 Tax=Neiella holothuriorum TaxID=2870530 RepID=A0ABS7EHV9_9GAMM|nr:polysaccharide lyase family 7 protein [Neiella holothuriorum]MBW8191905.1 polysaccharide lyase family 7 protein [Neiella holothuriorum]